MSIPPDATRPSLQPRGSAWTRGLLIALVTGLCAPAASGLAERSAAAAPSKARKKQEKKKRKRRKKRRASKKRSVTITPPCEVRTSDIIQNKIDIGAQYSMMRKMSGDDTSRLEASSILRALDDGTLAAVLLPPRKAVSDRGQRMSPKQGYWTMIPKGQNSVCLREPAGEAPMILYRENLLPSQLDAAITEAWEACDLPRVPRACEYVVDLHKPDWDCTSDRDCEQRHGSDQYYCNLDTHTCALDMPETPLETSCELPPNCIVGDAYSTFRNCGGSWGANLCLPREGQTCGVCQGQTDDAEACHEKNNETHTAARAQCKAEHSFGKTAKYTVECMEHIGKCASNPVRNPKACVDAIACGVDPAPVKEFQQCMRRETDRWDQERERCNQL